MQLHDALGPIYEDADFADLFPKRGRAPEAPWRLAVVTVLQALENLSDRQVAEMVRDGWIGNMRCPCRRMIRASTPVFWWTARSALA